MSDYITFEDGRSCSLASSLLAGILEDAARCAPASLSFWLNDVAKRPSGLVSFDVRGFAPHVRAELYASLRRAFSNCLAETENSPIQDDDRLLRAWRKLIETCERSLNHLPAVDDRDARRFDWDGDRIDIRLLWFCPSCAERLTPMPNLACDQCGWRHPDAEAGVQ